MVSTLFGAERTLWLTGLLETQCYTAEIPEAGWLAVAANLKKSLQVVPSADMRPLLSGMSKIFRCSAGLSEAGRHEWQKQAGACS